MFINSNDVEEIIRIVDGNYANRTVVLMIAETDMPNINSLTDKLNRKDIKFIGGIFPQVIYGNNVYDSGVVIKFIQNEVSTLVMNNIKDKNYTIPELDFDKTKNYCAFTFIDGLTGNISYFLSELYRKFGNNCSYLGGGAGSLSLQQKPCMFDNQGFYMDTAITIVFESNVSIGVKHGWKKIEGPIIATKTDKNVIQELNWRNAFEVYKEVIQSDTKTELRQDNFFDIAKAYPFGMLKANAECIVRDPIATNEKGELICVGEIMENTAVDVLKGEKDNLINSAKAAAEDAINGVTEIRDVLVIDCISRVLFLEQDFKKELDNVLAIINSKDNDASISGALTLGEISSYHGFLEFLNKTLVIGVFS